LLGLVFVYSRPITSTSGGVPELTKDFFTDDFGFKVPDSWQRERTETGVTSIQDAAEGVSMQANWDSVRNKNVSPSAPLSKAAKDIQDNDIFGLTFKPGTDITIGGRPGYRFEFDNPDQKQSGVEYLIISQTNNFYEIIFKGPTDKWATSSKLADAIVQTIQFK
jgi:hypothetical protein